MIANYRNDSSDTRMIAQSFESVNRTHTRVRRSEGDTGQIGLRQDGINGLNRADYRRRADVAALFTTLFGRLLGWCKGTLAAVGIGVYTVLDVGGGQTDWDGTCRLASANWTGW